MSNNETGLMKKTKKELVDIILRKDDEEKRLKKEVESSKNDVCCKEQTFRQLRDSLEKANHNVQEHQSTIDDLTSDKVAAEEAAKKFKKERDNDRAWICVLAITIAIMATLWILI